MREVEAKDVLVMVNDKLVKAGKIRKTNGGYQFYKKVNRAKHFVRKFKGYAIDERVYKKMLEVGVKEFVFDEDGKLLIFDVDTMKNFAFIFDFNHGKQICIEECYNQNK